MKFRRLLATSLVVSGFLAFSPASAAPLLFSFTGSAITGPVTASFQLDSNPTPDSINNQPAFSTGQIFFNNVSGIFNGNAETASTIAFGFGLASQFQILGTSAGFAQFGGDTVFSGPLTSPIFMPGTYNFTGFSRGTLTISAVNAPAVPEPASWAMMLGGFGAMGGAMRHRRRKAVVSFA